MCDCVWGGRGGGVDVPLRDDPIDGVQCVCMWLGGEGDALLHAMGSEPLDGCVHVLP